jgi:hypothetical protein
MINTKLLNSICLFPSFLPQDSISAVLRAMQISSAISALQFGAAVRLPEAAWRVAKFGSYFTASHFACLIKNKCLI